MNETRSLRGATDEDYRWFAHFLPQLENGDALPSEEHFLSQYRHRTYFFGEHGRDPLGCVVLDALSDTGYVRVVVVDAPARGRGVGRAMMDAVAKKLTERGCTRWCLNVKVNNTAAIRLYERGGMAPAYESHALSIAWSAVSALPSPSRRTVAREVAPSEDAALERAWALPSGQLAGWRAMTGQTLLTLSDPSDPDDVRLGIARANPSHPGTFPFRVAEPSLARALLEAARPLFAASGPTVGIVVEDDAALAALLLAHGATRRMHLLHMRGPICTADALAAR